MKKIIRNLEVKLRLDSVLSGLPFSTRMRGKLIPSPVFYQPNTKRTYYSGRCAWKLDMSDPTQRDIAVGSLSFARTITTLLCDSGGAIVDAGANRGGYSIPLAKQLRGKSKIHAFEPNPVIYNELNYHIELNGLDDSFITTNQFAIGRENSSILISEPEHNSGATSAIWKYDDSDIRNQFKVSLRSLDSLFEHESVCFLKVDVEGMDEDVLRGALKLIRRCKPSIYVEVSDKTISSISNFLENEEYRVYFVDESSHSLHRLESFSGFWGNIIALPLEKQDLLDGIISH